MQSKIPSPSTPSNPPNSRSRFMSRISQGNFFCPFCERAYTSLPSLWEHTHSQHWKVEEFPCETCETVYYDRPGRSKCQRRHRDKYTCNQGGCAYRGLTLASVRKHLTKVHNVPIAIASLQSSRTVSGDPSSPSRRVQIPPSSRPLPMTKDELWKASCETRLRLQCPENCPPSIHYDTRPDRQVVMTYHTGETGASSSSPVESAAVHQPQAQAGKTTDSVAPLPTHETMSAIFSAMDRLSNSLSREAPAFRHGDATIPSTPGESSTHSTRQMTPPSTSKVPDTGTFVYLVQPTYSHRMTAANRRHLELESHNRTLAFGAQNTPPSSMPH